MLTSSPLLLLLLLLLLLMLLLSSLRLAYILFNPGASSRQQPKQKQLKCNPPLSPSVQIGIKDDWREPTLFPCDDGPSLARFVRIKLNQMPEEATQGAWIYQLAVMAKDGEPFKREHKK